MSIPLIIIPFCTPPNETNDNTEAVITTFRILGTFLADSKTDTVPLTAGVSRSELPEPGNGDAI